jgi:hypothetical protein
MAVVEETGPTRGRYEWREHRTDTSSHSGRAALWCALVTLAAVPVSFFGTSYASMALSGQKDFNTPAVVFYFFLCLVLAPVPLALVSSYLIAPCIARVARGRLPAAGSHVILVAVWVGLVFSFRLAAPHFSDVPRWLLVWVVLFGNLATLQGPAVIAGSFVYSLRYNSIRRRLTPCPGDCQV